MKKCEFSGARIRILALALALFLLAATAPS